MGILVLEIHQIENNREGKYKVISKFLTQAAKDNGVRDGGWDWQIKDLALVTFSSNCWIPRSGQRSSLDRFRSLGWRHETSQRMELGLRNSIGTAFKFWLLLWNYTFSCYRAIKHLHLNHKSTCANAQALLSGGRGQWRAGSGHPLGRRSIHQAKCLADSGDGQFAFNGNFLKLEYFSWKIGYWIGLCGLTLKPKCSF